MHLVLLLVWAAPADANMFMRDSVGHRLPSLITWRERQGLSHWGELSFKYSPHFVLMSGSDRNTIASIGSKLSHKLGVSLKKNVGDGGRIGLSYTADLLNFHPSQDVARLTETKLLLHEVLALGEYYFDYIGFFVNAGVKERPYYIRLGSNTYDMESDMHTNFAGGLRWLAFNNGSYILSFEGLYGYYLKGSENFQGNEDISALQGAVEFAWQSREYEMDRTRWALEIYYRNEFCDVVGGGERKLQDIGLNLKYDISF